MECVQYCMYSFCSTFKLKLLVAFKFFKTLDLLISTTQPHLIDFIGVAVMHYVDSIAYKKHDLISRALEPSTTTPIF